MFYDFPEVFPPFRLLIAGFASFGNIEGALTRTKQIKTPFMGLGRFCTIDIETSQTLAIAENTIAQITNRGRQAYGFEVGTQKE